MNNIFDTDLLLNNSCEYTFCEEFNLQFSKYNSKLSLLHLNARSLNKNFDALQILLSSLNFTFDVIAVTETWFNSSTNIDMYDLQEYSLISKCRTSKSGGGVALYLKNNLIYNILHDFTCSESNYEMMFIEITTKPKPIIVACIYRPPDSDISCFNEKMQNVLEMLESEQKDIYILGEFNINLLNYGIHNKTNDFLDTMFSFNLYPLITKPTRITENKASLIDNIFTNTIQEEKHTGLIYSDLSDHFPVFSMANELNVHVKPVTKYIKNVLLMTHQ